MARIEGRQAVDEQFESILRNRALRTLFQPVVHLPSRTVVGYEALVRGPEGSELASADALLAAADRAGRVVEFDWAARASACRAAFDANLDREYFLFLNIEPIALDSDCPSDLRPDIERAFRTFQVVLEVTERSLDRDPGTLLDGVERQRPLVAGIGLDDVGSDPATVAMLPLVAPNVIKLDRTVVQAVPSEEVARILNAVHGESDRTGAVIMAEGVETVQHLHHTLSHGVLLGQGTLLGEPAPLPRHAEPPRHREGIRRSAPMTVATPFDALAGQVNGTATDDLLLELTRHMGSYADVSRPALYLSLLPGPQLLEGADLRRLTRLAREGAFAAVLGPGVPPEPGHGVRGTGGRREPLPRDEWAVVAVGPCPSAAVLARRSPDRDGEWIYGVTHDPQRVIAAARSLARLLGPPEPRFEFSS